MPEVVDSEIGIVKGKTLAIAVFGDVSPAETILIKGLLESGPGEIRAYNMATQKGITSVSASELGKGASILLVLGDQDAVQSPLSEMTLGMSQFVVVDSHTNRRYFDIPPSGVRLERFFGREAELERAKAQDKAARDRARTMWIVSISILVTVIGISNAFLMSVTERFREIGTMKCLGALSGFIRQLFLVESALVGFVGSVVGVLLGMIFPLAAYGATYSFPVILSSLDLRKLVLTGMACAAFGMVLSIAAAIYPAMVAARMVPAMALRSNV